MVRYHVKSFLLVAVVMSGCSSSSPTQNCTNLINAAVSKAPAGSVDASEQSLLVQQCTTTLGVSCTTEEFTQVTNWIATGAQPTSGLSQACAQAGMQFVVSYSKAKNGQLK